MGTGLADGFGDLSGIDIANSANVNLQNGIILNQAIEPNTKSLLHFDGANGSNTTSDAVVGHTVTFGGAAQISTAQSVFGGSSPRVAGGSDYVQVAASTDFGLGAGDFTVNARVRFDNPSSVSQIFCSIGPLLFMYQASGKLAVYDNQAGGYILVGTTPPAANTWYDYEVTRTGGTMRLFINGSQEASVANTTSYPTSNAITFGQAYPGSGSQQLIGYVDEFRLSNIARHTANFTPATSAFAYGTSGNLTLPSIAYPLPAGVPTKGSIFIKAKAVAGTLTVNSNFIASLSRNGAFGAGSSVDVTLTTSMTLPDGYSIFEANEVDLTGVTSAGNLKGYLRTTDPSLGVAVKGWTVTAH